VKAFYFFNSDILLHFNNKILLHFNNKIFNLIFITKFNCCSAHNRRIRGPQCKMMFAIGLFAGLCFAGQSSSQRLMGLEENAHEVQKYGLCSPEEFARYEARNAVANAELIDSSLRKD
jgi:hypothetical protein